jgi:hypothetical protein
MENNCLHSVLSDEGIKSGEGKERKEEEDAWWGILYTLSCLRHPFRKLPLSVTHEAPSKHRQLPLRSLGIRSSTPVTLYLKLFLDWKEGCQGEHHMQWITWLDFILVLSGCYCSKISLLIGYKTIYMTSSYAWVYIEFCRLTSIISN